MMLDAATTLTGVLIIGLLYFLPTICAWARHHHNAPAITATNLLVGWTLIGWVVALVWSLTRPAPATTTTTVAP